MKAISFQSVDYKELLIDEISSETINATVPQKENFADELQVSLVSNFT